MAISKKSRDLFIGALVGGAAATALNAVTNTLTANNANSFVKAIPSIGKMLVGGWLAYDGKNSDMARGAGLGAAGVGATELAQRYLPENMMPKPDGVSGYSYGDGSNDYYSDASSRSLNSFERHAANRIEPVTTYHTAYSPV